MTEHIAYRHATIKFFSDDQVYAINLGMSPAEINDWPFRYFSGTRFSEDMTPSDEGFLVEICSPDDRGQAWYISGLQSPDKQMVVVPLRRVVD